MSFWKQGPREWSPRLKRAEESIRLLRLAIPPELILEVDPDGSGVINGSPPKIGRLRVGDTTANLNEVYPYRPGIDGKAAFMVMTQKSKQGEPQFLSIVWILSDGNIAMNKDVVALWEGKAVGLESVVVLE
jgi:hypothetical protein